VQTDNIWNEFEYSKLKLLLHQEKVNSIFRVLSGESAYDQMPPISVELHLTDLCNLHCAWCTDGTLRRNKASNPKELLFELFDFFAAHGVGVTIEGGGEPSVHPDFAEIVRYGQKKNLSMGLISNGVLDFSALLPCFTWARISLDASTAQEYETEKGLDTFDTVLENLSRFAARRDPSHTHLGVGYVLTVRNQGRLLPLIRDLDRMGVDYVYLRPVEEAPDLTPSIDNLFSLKKELVRLSDGLRIRCLLTVSERLVADNDGLPCVCHSLSCIIQANGDVALCEKRRHDPIVLGNLRDSPFEELWNSARRRQASQRLLNPSRQKGCGVCRITSFNTVFADVSHIHTKSFI
jgi:radical SAM protein with 4Fe4S-binding SPASM domain